MFAARSTLVTTKSVPVPAKERARTVARLPPLGSPAHSGHLIPTGVNTMHSGQIGRPQFEHVTAVSFLGWR